METCSLLQALIFSRSFLLGQHLVNKLHFAGTSRVFASLGAAPMTTAQVFAPACALRSTPMESCQGHPETVGLQVKVQMWTNVQIFPVV